MTIKVEIANRPDMDALATLHASCFSHAWAADAFHDMLAVAGTKAFVAWPWPALEIPLPQGEGWVRAGRHSPCLAGTHPNLLPEGEGIPGTGMQGSPTDPLSFGIARAIGEEAEILTLAVPPALRGRGVGNAITQVMRDWAAAQGCRAMFLEVGESNGAACRLYARNGFTVISRRKDYYRKPDGSYEDALVMRLAFMQEKQ